MNLFARKQCILCSELRQKSYLHYLNVTPLRDSFYLGTFAQGFIMLLPSTQPRVFAKLLVSIKFLETKSGFFFALYMQYSPPFHMCGRTFQCLTALYWFKLQIKRVHNKSIRSVQLLFNFVDLTKTKQLSAFMYSNYMYQGFKAITHFQKTINNWNYCSAGKNPGLIARSRKIMMLVK